MSNEDMASRIQVYLKIETIFSRDIYKDSDGRNYIYASGIVGRKRG